MQIAVSKPKELKKKQPTDIREIYESYLDKYNQVFIEDYGESGTFIFHTLGRSDFKQLRDTDAVNNCDKEEIICEQCVLYPENYDFANCDEAGLPTKLAKSILEKSMLKSSDQLTGAIHYYRDKLRDELDEQITCIIHEAFPEYTIKEIGNWDVVKTADYYTRAEYILNNLRGVPLVPVNDAPAPSQSQTQARQRQQTMQERFQPIETSDVEDRTPRQSKKQTQQTTINTQSKTTQQETRPTSTSKNALTPEKLAELQMRFPTIDWAHDSVAQKGMDAFRVQEIDDTTFAERALDGSDISNDALPEAMRSKFKVIGSLNT